MEISELKDKLLDYVYGEISPADRAALEKALRTDPELKKEYQSLLQLRKVIQHDLPTLKVPKELSEGVYRGLGLKQPWYEVFRVGLSWRPLLAVAAMLVVTLGVTYKYKERQQLEIAKGNGVTGPLTITPKVKGSLENLKFSDVIPVQHELSPVSFRPSWQQTQPNLGGGTVSLAAYGAPQYSTPILPPQQMEIHNMDQEANHDVAQFAHQQALRFRMMGDFRETAKALAKVIKDYPDYAGKFEALAQRIDCLFRSGQTEIAKRELIWLGAFAPDLAYLVAERWAQ